MRHLPHLVLAVLLTACHGHETPGSADEVAHVGDRVRGPHRTAEQIVSAQIRAAVLDWTHQVIGPDDVDDVGAGTYVVTFESGQLVPGAPGELRFLGHGLEGLDTKVLVSFSDHVDVTETHGEMPGPFGGSHRVELHYSVLDGDLVLEPAIAAALVEDLDRAPLITQFLIRTPGSSGGSMIECDLLGVRVLAPSRDEVLLEGVPARPLRG